MSEMIRLEAVFFATAFLWGIFLLVGYDIIRILRRIIPHNAMIVAVEDMFFWTIGGILVFCMMYEKNDGIVRGIALLSLFSGMFCYHYMVSKYVVRWIYQIVGVPIKKILNVVKKILKNGWKTVKLINKGRERANEPEGGDQDGKE
ncbi:spore cortex biosynthesis protein YabQ [Velocimicrobium porci]|uniref:Spore cortex biosynthesis protein YabQ n=1 Tax=Velocimicrobium porci TaxID=2606634 RepID=A0A6L5XZD2_9FIRM|nr:spore cortex biosynthesis protein YabQ [Velocimicrobium porci]MSS63927.1 spore cortex biosynthesis protein YabQ [Velocimicrobium porci]